MKKISIVTPCYNEEENVAEIYQRIRQVMEALPYEYEHIFIDNASTDQTVKLIRQLIVEDPRVKAILNTRNFGPVRSPYYGIMQAHGDAVICLSSDLQDPPEKIPEFIQKWENGYLVVVGVKAHSEESKLFYFLRSTYYYVLRKISDVQLIDHFTGFGLYDQKIVELLHQFNDPNPYFRGLIADIGYEIALLPFNQPRRKRGISKNNVYRLYDLAMLGMTSYTRIPLRLATLLGFISAAVSFLIGLIYLVYKLLLWKSFSLGLAPVVIGLFFLGSVQLFFMGILGEYIGAIYTLALHRPPVIEKERINF